MSDQDWIERLYNLRRDKKGLHEKPHKPVLLLAVLDLIERGEIADNRVPLSADLVDRYKQLFEIVGTETDQPNPHLPLYHLSGDKFWHLRPQEGHGPVYEEGNVSAPKSLARLRDEVRWAEFDPELWSLLSTRDGRAQVREALVARYFAPFRDALIQSPSKGIVQREPDGEDIVKSARDAAFRKTIRQIYDHRCAACGVRVLLETERRHVLIEAAHLIPWEESHNDHPSNGMALCRNHHWAVDEHLIAPCPSLEHKAGVWRVSPVLDDRIADLKDFARLENRRVIRPLEAKFLPSREALEWREAHLLG